MELLNVVLSVNPLEVAFQNQTGVNVSIMSFIFKVNIFQGLVKGLVSVL